MTGTGSGTTTHAADVKQAIGSGDQPGAYSVAITFTGAVS
jgi:putative effector of murein hydrolase